MSTKFSGDPDALAAQFAALTLTAAVPIMEIYGRDIAARAKADGSPVSEADERAEVIILAALARLLPGVTIIAEEATARQGLGACGTCFVLVDPLDGTREFLQRNGEFTVNIALVRDGRPVAGAVFAPALGRLFWGGTKAFACEAQAGGALPPRAAWRPLHVRDPGSQPLVAMASRSHGDAHTKSFLASVEISEWRAAGSSLKFCALAAGEADIYPRFGPTMEWDTAAGDAVLRAAGGMVFNEHGAPLAYGKTDLGLRNGAFLACTANPPRQWVSACASTKG
ncbi:MAG: 3'(2'),5'-bisphosphate nucleotidase CysQ [Hyphomicrobiales bacterium]|nr:3'(2'),5'-bisphosphate nucleotidase CysQ [Hyphomicrobiales bacterium]